MSDRFDWNTFGGDRYYDREGRPIGMMRWSELLGDEDYKILQQDVFVMAQEPVKVSTVWLGLNHNWTGGAPLIFETMIFGGTHDLMCWRASNEQDALEAHREAVTLLQLELGVLDEPDDVQHHEHGGDVGPPGERQSPHAKGPAGDQGGGNGERLDRPDHC